MISRVFKYLRLEQNISEPRTDYGLLLEKTIGLFLHFDIPLEKCGREQITS